MSEAFEAALKIMALVDEYPSEPFSYERKQLEVKLEELLTNFGDVSEEAKEQYYQVGYDEGFDEGQSQAEMDYDRQIQDLEEEVDDLKRELEDAQGNLEQAFTEGYETATRTENSIENFKFS